ncbi:MAG TPA: cold shock domain-containing protein [Xanthobacteraceae bacterium]|nr:cold shock domain-containing protein [Xanthobacteraceae bacterium]
MDFHGVVDHWKEDRGFGFVELSDRRRVFCHITALRQAGLDKLRAGQRVEVDIVAAADGRPRVSKIALVEPPAAGSAAELADASRVRLWVHEGRD